MFYIKFLLFEILCTCHRLTGDLKVSLLWHRCMRAQKAHIHVSKEADGKGNEDDGGLGCGVGLDWML